MKTSKSIKVRYFAALREAAQLSEEMIVTQADSALELYQELEMKYNFKLNEKHLKLSLNQEFTPLHASIQSGDELVFIPPVAGG